MVLRARRSRQPSCILRGQHLTGRSRGKKEAAQITPGLPAVSTGLLPKAGCSVAGPGPSRSPLDQRGPQRTPGGRKTLRFSELLRKRATQLTWPVARLDTEWRPRGLYRFPTSCAQRWEAQSKQTCLFSRVLWIAKSTPPSSSHWQKREVSGFRFCPPPPQGSLVLTLSLHVPQEGRAGLQWCWLVR